MRWRLALMVFSGIGALLFLILTATTDLRVRQTETPRIPMSATLSAPARNIDPATPSAKTAFAVGFTILSADALPFPARNDRPIASLLEGRPTATSAIPPLVEWTTASMFPAFPRVESVDARLQDEHGVYREAVAMVTAYCPCARCCGSFADGRTSTGASAWRPGLAAAPLALPYGTRVFVPGYGHSVVDDTGGAMRRSWRTRGQIHIDVRMNYHYEARVWGVQYLNVRIYDTDAPGAY